MEPKANLSSLSWSGSENLEPMFASPKPSIFNVQSSLWIGRNHWLGFAPNFEQSMQKKSKFKWEFLCKRDVK